MEIIDDEYTIYDTEIVALKAATICRDEGATVVTIKCASAEDADTVANMLATLSRP